MYTPTNYYNPYMSQIQQQPQMQIPAQNNLYNQSPYMSQNNNQLSQPTCINGKIVDSEDILKVTEIPMGGFGVFPKADFNEIYLKYWKDNGTTEIVTFKPVRPKPIMIEQDDPIKQILEKVDQLDKKFNSLYERGTTYQQSPQLESQPTQITRKEVSLDEY